MALPWPYLPPRPEMGGQNRSLWPQPDLRVEERRREVVAPATVGSPLPRPDMPYLHVAALAPASD